MYSFLLSMSLPSRREKCVGLLLGCGEKLGLNERGCYVTLGLGSLAVLLLLVILIMAASWPGE